MNNIKSENHFQAILEHTPVYLFVLSDDGRLLFINDYFKNDLQIENDHADINDLLTAGSKIFLQVHLFPLIKLQHKIEEVFLSFLAQDNSEIPVLLNISRILENGIYKVYFSGIKITERNKYEKEILNARENAEKALLENTDNLVLKQKLHEKENVVETQLQEIFRYNDQQQQINKVLSHDLQETQRKIMMFASLIHCEDNHINENLVKIIKLAQRQNNLLNRMQRLYALDNHSFKISKVNLTEILRIAESKISDYKIAYTIAPDIINDFNADQEQLINLFVELFDNSVKFKRNETALNIHINSDILIQNIYARSAGKYQYEKYVRIVFSDNGTGFSTIFSTKVFDLFTKINSNEGLGVGLTFVKRIALLHKGSVSIDSAENEGTSVTILLPYF